MKRTYINKIIPIIFLFLSQLILGQQKYNLEGIIKDANSGEGLMGVNILVAGKGTGTVSNEEGLFNLSLPEGTYDLDVSYVGYRSRNIHVNVEEDRKENILLLPTEESLEEVVIYQNRNDLLLSEPEISIIKLNSKTIKNTPAVLGEPDVLKSILQMPGVTNSGEGTAGFNVRGGSADQNLVLLDGAPVYNTSHLFGFFSVFNNDAIEDVRLYKGGIPAEYGGRVASVLDIQQRTGNDQNFKINGGIGVIASRLLAEGPIVKNKSSFLISGRASFPHLFLKATGNDNSAYFYDINTKLKHRFNENNALYLSGYFGRDYFSMNEDFENLYGNSILNLTWKHSFSENLNSDLSLNYSDYHFDLNIKASGFESTTGIENLNLNYDLDHNLNENLKLNYGLNLSAYKFNPGEITPTEEGSGLNYLKIEDKNALEGAAYLEAEHRFSPRIKVNYGVRYSRFHRIGKETQNLYENNEPVNFNRDLNIYEKATPVATQEYDAGETITSYDNWEPRISMVWSGDNESVKLGYNRTSQYIHMLSNTLSPTPMDLWIPSDTHIKPQILDQVAAGYYRKFGNGGYTLELEAFAKQVKNRINYIDGADLIGNPAIEQVLLNGEERAKGMEVLVKKNSGSLTGWLAYTLSKAEQRTPGRTDEEPGINSGNWYNANHDRTHDLSLTANYKISNKWRLAANFNFQTGRATTFPEGYYKYLDIKVPRFGDRNAGRLPAYHRLDVSATYTPRPNKEKGWKSRWNFGVYNVYNRRNAHSISFSQNRETGSNEAVRLSVFGIIPSITYNFQF